MPRLLILDLHIVWCLHISLVDRSILFVLLPPPQIGLMKDTLFEGIFCKKVNEEEMRTNKCSYLRNSWVKVDQKIRARKYSCHAVSWRVDNNFVANAARRFASRLSIQYKIRSHWLFHNGIYKIAYIKLHHFTIVHSHHKVLRHHISAQQKMHCLWVHCVSFMSFRMNKLTEGLFAL